MARTSRVPWLAWALAWSLVPASAHSQQPDPASSTSEAPMPQVHEHGEAVLPHPTAREWGGSGSSWVPDSSPMYMAYTQSGAWQWMTHGTLFVQYLNDAGPRGREQLGSINWLMVMGRRSVGKARVTVRGMVSAEPWTIPGCGYPDLLASGERCEGEPIVDLQHPHDAFMELTIGFDRPLTSTTRWFVYGGAAGEPALGPVAFPHRLSSTANPLAPVSHHWFDSTHVAFGVVTGGVFGERWKAEGSAFNGREPDEARRDFDLGPLDSASGRLSWAPTSDVVLQVSAAHLREAEPGHDLEAATDVTRLTASVIVQKALGSGGWWASTLAMGRNHERGGTSQFVMGEASVTWRERDVLFWRAEVGTKTTHDLSLNRPPEAFTVAKVQTGYSRFLPARGGFQPGLGVTVTAGIVPDALASTFGQGVNGGCGVYLVLRPARH